jgi:hypothetical protein
LEEDEDIKKQAAPAERCGSGGKFEKGAIVGEVANFCSRAPLPAKPAYVQRTQATPPLNPAKAPFHHPFIAFCIISVYAAQVRFQ